MAKKIMGLDDLKNAPELNDPKIKEEADKIKAQGEKYVRRLVTKPGDTAFQKAAVIKKENPDNDEFIQMFKIEPPPKSCPKTTECINMRVIRQRYAWDHEKISGPLKVDFWWAPEGVRVPGIAIWLDEDDVDPFSPKRKCRATISGTLQATVEIQLLKGTCGTKPLPFKFIPGED